MKTKITTLILTLFLFFMVVAQGHMVPLSTESLAYVSPQQALFKSELRLRWMWKLRFAFV